MRRSFPGLLVERLSCDIDEMLEEITQSTWASASGWLFRYLQKEHRNAPNFMAYLPAGLVKHCMYIPNDEDAHPATDCNQPFQPARVDRRRLISGFSLGRYPHSGMA